QVALLAEQAVMLLCRHVATPGHHVDGPGCGHCRTARCRFWALSRFRAASSPAGAISLAEVKSAPARSASASVAPLRSAPPSAAPASEAGEVGALERGKFQI